MKNNAINHKGEWDAFYRNWKAVWRNPEIGVYEKATLFNVFLYRSDHEGWCISERKMASDLHISKNRASMAIKVLMKRGLIFGNGGERKRRKLRLSESLQSPNWISAKPNNWIPREPTKYQDKYQNNNEFKNSDKRAGKMEKILSPDQLHKRIQELKIIRGLR